jgi:hypothetical protein
VRDFSELANPLVGGDPRLAADRTLGLLLARCESSAGAVLKNRAGELLAFVQRELPVDRFAHIQTLWREHRGRVESGRMVRGADFVLVPLRDDSAIVGVVFLERPSVGGAGPTRGPPVRRRGAAGAARSFARAAHAVPDDGGGDRDAGDGHARLPVARGLARRELRAVRPGRARQPRGTPGPAHTRARPRIPVGAAVDAPCRGEAAVVTVRSRGRGLLQPRSSACSAVVRRNGGPPRRLACRGPRSVDPERLAADG